LGRKAQSEKFNSIGEYEMKANKSSLDRIIRLIVEIFLLAGNHAWLSGLPEFDLEVEDLS
jgi:hypothetical protein